LESYQEAGLISKEEYEQNKEATFIKDVEG
jgi:hypothetical protein